MVLLQKKMSFAVDPGELPVPICLPDCQTECKTKWGRRFANEIEEEEITVQNPKGSGYKLVWRLGLFI